MDFIKIFVEVVLDKFVDGVKIDDVVDDGVDFMVVVVESCVKGVVLDVEEERYMDFRQMEISVRVVFEFVVECLGGNISGKFFVEQFVGCYFELLKLGFFFCVFFGFF